jgi:predicted metal-dependent phosphoesterase TrpH
MKKALFLLMLAMPLAASAQISNDDVHKYDHLYRSQYRNEISIPGFDGYQTLKCDFHIHTVLSDGSVWPTVRVQEAWREGLDAIAITEHIEYRPNKETVIADHNESFNIAKKASEKYGIIVIKGAELTRKKPLGHMNALFITDANALEVKDPLQAIDIARAQGGYILWNHPGWPDNNSTIYDVHAELLKQGKIDAYEVCNHMESYPLTYDWFAQYNIAPMANTDIHATVEGDFGSGAMRPMTLVFATDRTEEAIREALDAKRTAALFFGNLVGAEEYLSKMLAASLKTRRISEKKIEVTNVSDITYKMKAGNTLYIFPAGKAAMVTVPTDELTVLNCFIGFEKNLTWRF